MSKLLGLSVFLISVLFAGFAYSQTTDAPPVEAEFSKEQLNEYYKVYSDQDVKHIRSAITAFLANTKVNPIEAAALKGIDKDHLRSKFIVLSHDNHAMGGKSITLIFQDHPDKVFVTWVYPKGAKWELRDFHEDKAFGETEVRQLRIRYRRFLEDKDHAM